MGDRAGGETNVVGADLAAENGVSCAHLWRICI